MLLKGDSNPLLFSGCWQVICNTIFTILVIKGLQSTLKRTDAFYRQKGVEHALDYMCGSLHFVAVGISRWLRGWWTHSYPAGHRHRRGTDPSHPGTKNIVAI